MRIRLVLLALAACSGQADVRDCVCDLASPAIAETRGCSLCLEAERHPATETIFLARDNDPTKPNRWLAVPRAKLDGANPLARMSAEERLALWTMAIAKAKEVWGESWGIAMNGDIARRQCHAHVHIGKLREGLGRRAQAGIGAERHSDDDDEREIYVDGPAQLPAISDGTGLWFHPAGNRLHVHLGEQTTETVLLR